MILPEIKPPSRVVNNAASWGFPRRGDGVTLLDSDWLTPMIKHWVVEAAKGDVIDVRGPMAGTGVTAVGDAEQVDLFFAALLNDLVRQPAVKGWEDINANFARFYTHHEIQRRARDDYQAVEDYNSYKLLVVAQVDAADKWACNTLTDIVAMRMRLSRPTLVGMSPESCAALWPDDADLRSSHHMLADGLQYANFLVDLREGE